MLKHRNLYIMNRERTTTALKACLLLCGILTIALNARAGAILDPTFGINGEADVAGRLFAVQSDGKIVSADRQEVSDNTFDLTVRRYTANGIPDPSFGTGGVVVTDVTTCNDSPIALAVQPDGKIVVVEYQVFCPYRIPATLVRYLSDGTLDPTFGTDGRVFITDQRIAEIVKIIVQPDGKIVAVGQGQGMFMIARFTSTGMFDRPFGKQGIATQLYRPDCPICFSPAELSAVTQEPDGGYLVAGVMISTTDHSYYVVGRFDGMGSLEYLRGSDSNQVNEAPTFRSVSRLPNGKILAIGDQIARFTPDGFLDPTFTQNQALRVSRGRTGGNGVLTPDGKILQVGGFFTLNTSESYIRLFGENGATIGQINRYGGNYFAPTALIQPDGKLIVASDKMRRYLSISSLASKQSDFDGDLISDIGYFRPSTGTWGIKYSTTAGFSTGGEVSFGLAGDIPTPGHYVYNERPSLGNLRATTSSVAVYRPSDLAWYVSSASGTSAYVTGSPGDLPVNGDYDGDGVDDLTAFQNGNWRIIQSSTGTQLNLGWGLMGDLAVPGDYDYDGSTDLAVFRPSNGTWYVRFSSNGALFAQQFGSGTDRVVPGDYDGDGRNDLAVYRPSEGIWYIRNSHDGSLRAQQFGVSTDRPAPGDYDGDGKTDPAVYRDGTWYILQSSTGSVRVENWGQAGDVPLTPGFTAE